ncbi:MAG: hypothetical protein IJR59_04775 [Firmicutes bacterium]|nr:hypothetical protein [Bacillota bacterium]
MYIEINEVVCAMTPNFDNETYYFDTDTYEIKSDIDGERLEEPYRYIEIPKTDYRSIRKEFLIKNNIVNKSRLDEYANDGDKFHILINNEGIYIYNEYIDHERNAEKRFAAEWCAENGIKYTLKEGKTNEGN